jgi:hypothetical protein
MPSDSTRKSSPSSTLRGAGVCRRAPALFFLCLASPLFARSPATALARQLNVEAESRAVFAAAFAPTSTECRFTSGPLAGTIGEYDSPSDEKIGSPCDDGKGSRGTVVAQKPAENAGGKPRKIDRKTQQPPPPAAEVRPAPIPAMPVQHLPAPPAPVQQQPVQSQPNQSHPAGGNAHPDASTAYANLTDAQIQQEFDQIVQQASNGAIRYTVPPVMTVGQPVTVEVEVSGANASQAPSDLQATGSGNLKVTPLMEVDLNAPSSPGMFTIVPDSVQTGQQMVPDDGKTDWLWTVTPLQGGQQPASLQIDAYMVLNAKLPDGQAVTRQITSYTVQVPIKTQSGLQAVLSFLGRNWSTLLGFILPSGAGLTFILWFVTRNKPKRKVKVHST